MLVISYLPLSQPHKTRAFFMEKESITLNEIPITFTRSVNGELGNKVECKPSSIHGVGLFAKEDISENFDIHQTHVIHPEYGVVNIKPNNLYNHSSESPNCKAVKFDNFYHLFSLREIKAGEELLADYGRHRELEPPKEGWKSAGEYYVAYYHCTEDLKNHPIDTWIVVLEYLDGPIVCQCGDIQMTDVRFKYFPIPQNHPCLNQINRGYALGNISYHNGQSNLLVKPKSFPSVALHKLRWKIFDGKYRFCVEDKENKFCEMDYVDQLVMFRGIPYVSRPHYKNNPILNI